MDKETHNQSTEVDQHTITRTQVCQTIGQWAANVRTVNAAHLFGSRVRSDDWEPGPSDLDIFVEVQNPADAMLDKDDWRAKLEQSLPYEIHIIDLDPSNTDLIENVRDNHITVFTREGFVSCI